MTPSGAAAIPRRQPQGLPEEPLHQRLNVVVCSGIPGKYVLKEGDVVNVDITTIIDDHFGDINAAFVVGEVDRGAKSLVSFAKSVMMNAMGQNTCPDCLAQAR